MLSLRKMDANVQTWIGIFVLSLLPLLFLCPYLLIEIPWYLACLYGLAGWQPVSAMLNTRAFIKAGLKKSILTYWKWMAIDLVVIFGSLALLGIFDPDDMVVSLWIGLAAYLGIGIYYVHIYKRLVNLLELQHELGGLTKSKH